MIFCTNCGRENSEKAEFCTNCGKPLPAARRAAETEAATNPVQPEPSGPVKKPMKKRSKIAWIVAGVLALALISTHFILASIYDPMKTINAMNTAYNDQDKEAFFKEFHLKKGTIANADHFYEAVSQFGWPELRNELTYEIEKIQNNQPADSIRNTGEFISVTRKPAVLGLYDEVDFTILPTTVSVTVPLANTTFQFGGQEVATTTDDETVEIGQFIPGEYEWSYELDSGLMPLSGKGLYELSPSELNKQKVEIDWDFTTLYVSSDADDAIVYINGESTKKKVSELREIYPAQLDKSVTFQAVTKDKDGKEVKSEEVPADSQELYLPFEHVQQEAQQADQMADVEQVYKDFRSAYSDAIYAADFSYIEGYFKSGSKIRTDYAKFVTDHSTIPGYHYEFLLNDVTSVKPLPNGAFELLSFEKFNYSSYEEGPFRYDRKKRYIFSFEDGQFYITEITDLDTKKTKY